LCDKILEFEEIPGGIATDTQFGEYDEVGACLLRLPDGIYDLTGVGLEVPDVIILLDERDLHTPNLQKTRLPDIISGALTLFRSMKNPCRSLSLVLVAVGFIFSLLLAACGHGDNAPDVSGVDVKPVQIVRYDTAWFSLDSNNIVPGLRRLSREYPYFTGDFVGNILGAGPLSDTSQVAFAASRQFLVSYLPVKDSLEKKYARLEWLKEQLTQSFRYIKYYFPRYNLPPKVVVFIGPFDGPGVAITQLTLAIGLQSYAGKNSSFYAGQDHYPSYITRRFEPEYIVPNSITALSEDIFPDSSDGRALVEQMIIKGKYLWLAGKLQPGIPDSIRTGYTQAQLKWCGANEAGIWNFFLQNTDLYTKDPDLIKNYIGDGPKTLGMPDTSPGNIGAWVGWQIVNKYVQLHPDITPVALMRTPALKIYEEAKYKPR